MMRAGQRVRGRGEGRGRPALGLGFNLHLTKQQWGVGFSAEGIVTPST